MYSCKDLYLLVLLSIIPPRMFPPPSSAVIVLHNTWDAYTQKTHASMCVSCVVTVQRYLIWEHWYWWLEIWWCSLFCTHTCRASGIGPHPRGERRRRIERMRREGRKEMDCDKRTDVGVGGEQWHCGRKSVRTKEIWRSTHTHTHRHARTYRKTHYRVMVDYTH